MPATVLDSGYLWEFPGNPGIKRPGKFIHNACGQMGKWPLNIFIGSCGKKSWKSRKEKGDC